MVRPGYKQTEVGVIPEDWEIRFIEDIGCVRSGKRLPLGHSLKDEETPYPYIRVSDMRPGTVAMSNIHFVPEGTYPSIKDYRIFREDIFISVAGTLGIVGIVPKELDGANLTENADRITNIRCSRDYLLYVLTSPLIQRTIDSIRTVGAQPKLALTRLRKFIIPLPPTEAEQEAIASALSDADALIESLERLIAKKRDIKQAAMQELLTGRKRLPGFEGAWVTKRLGEMGNFFKGSGVKKDDAQSGDLPCVRYGEIYTTHHNCIKEFSSWISREVADGATRIRCGDILFAGSGETKEEIGKCVALVGSEEAFAGGDIIVLRPKEACSAFLGYYLNTAPINRQKASLGQGDAIVHISSAALANIEVSIPESIGEQNAIAEVLLSMDIEIAALGEKMSKVQNTKQGMMQELLTGRIRLV